MKETAAQKGARDAWDFWLSQHPISVPEIIHDAVKEATNAWLNSYGDDLIKQAVTEWLDTNGDDPGKA